MTGNTSKWRAPLAGLASIAMLATMGVAASTANAATTGTSGDTTTNYKVNIYDPDQPWKPTSVSTTAKWGQVLTPLTADPYAAAGDGKVFDYFSYDKAGNEKIGDVLVVKGATKVFAQYKQAVKVSFDFNGDKTVDAAVDVAKGTALTASEYQSALSAASVAKDGTTGEPAGTGSLSGKTFAGLTYTYTEKNSADDLYTNQIFNADTTLYGRFDTNQNLSTVAFRNAGKSSPFATNYTLADHAFPEFRAPKTANWKVDGALEGADYDFTQSVKNKNQDAPTAADLTLVAPDTTSLQNVTVTYHFTNGPASNSTLSDGTNVVKTTADQKLTKPVDPVAFGAVFTGWYTNPAADGTSQAVKWDEPISKQNGYKANGTLDLWAGWDTAHAAELVYNLGYNADFDAATGGKQFEFVYAGTKKDLPAGLEEYYQTEAQKDAAKGEYTTRKLTGWYLGNNSNDVVTSATAPAAGSYETFTAKWDASYSVRLNGNGGKFDGQTYKWVTAAKGAKLADILVEPVRDGYTLAYWVVGDSTSTTKVDTSKTVDYYDGATLTAKWTASSKLDVNALRNQFKLAYNNQSADALTVAAYGYTDASAKAYIKAVYALEDQYKAYQSMAESQAKVDAASALLPKYQAAEQLLVKSNGADVPDGKVAVYRAFNPNETRGGSHLYTTSFAEYSSVVRAGWKAEGVQFQTTSSKKAEPVYRAYNPNDGSHFYTLSQVEFNHVIKAGWKDEGVAWYVAKDASESVLRIYNPNSGEHVFTLSKAEVNNAVKAGWNDEGVAFKAYAK
ncbi:InlB B-repeat-containing protein [Bifidobacterium sp. MA2]|uniref:InlB B-repeat-containing protein n=1 Tax=Bifidobacterium santillanense TaxID=2809028 RepID=A0ABS5USJ5_9BIFI|nr:InlB B-repeat-containing protein [Bifidobacterium santillanense]MBT1173867.1 InlB B-repeat-containing protein [Bifidobacterium santillanense]